MSAGKTQQRRERTEARVEEVDLPLCEKLSIGSLSLDRRKSLIFELASGDLLGRGEASPLPQYSDESFDDTRNELLERAEHLNKTPGALSVELPTFLESVKTPSARFALETAMVDLRRQEDACTHLEAWARYLELSVPSKESLELSALVSAPLPKLIEERLSQGFQTVKLKVRPGDFDKLASLARKFEGLKLRLDANRSLSVEEAKAYAALSLECFEEPVKTDDLAALAADDFPVFLDESLRSGPIEVLLDLPAVRGVVLKPTTLGGALPCLHISKLARDRNLSVVVTHCFEGWVAYRATCILAALFGTEASGLETHVCLQAWCEHFELPLPPLGPRLDLSTLEES